MSAHRPPRVLTIAGSDPSGGAGIQADLKSIAAFDGYGMAAVTSLTVQNTQGVHAVHAPPAPFLAQQLQALDSDIAIDAVKIGMLHSSEVVAVVDDWLARVSPPVVVLDPVMVATSGHRLLDSQAEAAVRALARRAHVVTPNLSELAVLVGAERAHTWEAALAQGRQLAEVSGALVVVKGGHLDGQDVPDALVSPDRQHIVAGRRISTRNTHGTGCSLSSALATVRASGLEWEEALEEVKAWLNGALVASDLLDVGRGHGPIDHGHHRRDDRAWASAAWHRCAPIRDEIDQTPFVNELASGTLSRSRFMAYLAQDVLYLGEYSAALDAIAELCDDPVEREVWRTAAQGCRAEVTRLHRDEIGESLPDWAPVTRGYIDHLRARVESGSYAQAVAAILPCYSVYAELGVRWSGIDRSAHPYAAWLDLYGGAEFVRAAARAESIADAVARRVDRAERMRMHAAYRESTRWEQRFFAEAAATSD
jgi:hydroxymethylpyrimidine/phosphomethylpyrimidine kinase